MLINKVRANCTALSLMSLKGGPTTMLRIISKHQVVGVTAQLSAPLLEKSALIRRNSSHGASLDRLLLCF